MDNLPPKLAPRIRPLSAIARLQHQAQSTPKSNHLLVAPDKVVINKENVRDTFRSLEELSAFMRHIEWPVDALRGGLEDLQTRLDELASLDAPREQLDRFRRIVQLALDIEREGQLQAVGGVPQGDHYRIILGSTRVMACWLMGRDVELRIMPQQDAVSELRAHLAENLSRENLTFAETARGYLRLFGELMDAEQIQQISITQVMKHLNLSRTHSRRWRSVLNLARNDEAYRTKILNGTITSLERADALTRQSNSRSNQKLGNSEAQSATNGRKVTSPLPSSSDDNKGTTGSVITMTNNPVNIENDYDLASVERLFTSLFRAEAQFQMGIDTQLAGRIDSYIGSHQNLLSKPSDLFIHVQWLMDTVCQLPPTTDT